MAAIRTRLSSSPMIWSKRNPITRSAICSRPKQSGGNAIAPRAKSNMGWWTSGGATEESDDTEYLKLTDDVIRLAQAQLAKSETAEMHTYAGLGWALKVRIYALRAEYRNAARTAVSGRTEMLAALKLDPDMADATAALGIYNYYVDAVSPIVKILRIFMGIPGGDKQTGRQANGNRHEPGIVFGRGRPIRSRKSFAHLRPEIPASANSRRAARFALSAQPDVSVGCSGTSTRSWAAKKKPRNIFTRRWQRPSPMTPAPPAAANSPILS